MNTVLRRSDQDRTSLRLRIPAEPSPLRNTNRITSNTANSKQNSVAQLAPPNLPQPVPREQRFSAPLPPPKSTPFPSQKTSRAVCVVRRLLERRRSLERVLCALMYRCAVLQAQARLRTTHTARRTFFWSTARLIYSVFL